MSWWLQFCSPCRCAHAKVEIWTAQIWGEQIGGKIRIWIWILKYRFLCNSYWAGIYGKTTTTTDASTGVVRRQTKVCMAMETELSSTYLQGRFFCTGRGSLHHVCSGDMQRLWVFSALSFTPFSYSYTHTYRWDGESKEIKDIKQEERTKQQKH